MFKIGKIVNTHGIKGEIKVKQSTDFEERFQTGSTVFVKKSDQTYKPLTIVSSRIHKGTVLLQFDGFTTINDVEHLKNETLFIQENQLTPLKEHEFYYYEIIGAEVETIDGQYIGKVDHILSPGANDVWVVKTEERKEVLIPYIEPVVKKVDVGRKKVVIELMEGLLD